MTYPNTPDPAAAGGNWTVTGQTETQEMDGTGRFVPGVQVAFRTQYGVDASVFVPHNVYTPTYVRQAITDKATVIDQVHFLTPDSD